MKKILFTLALCIIAFSAGFEVKSFAFCSIEGAKIAYVDINKLILSSKTVQQAQDNREKQTKAMLNWYDKANSEIEKQKNKEAKQSLIAKYEKELTQKKNMIQNEFSKDVEKADNQITGVINQKAQELGYSLILKKDSVLYGAEDITSSILPLIN